MKNSNPIIEKIRSEMLMDLLFNNNSKYPLAQYWTSTIPFPIFVFLATCFNKWFSRGELAAHPFSSLLCMSAINNIEHTNVLSSQQHLL
jgi:hypothetical protein